MVSVVPFSVGDPVQLTMQLPIAIERLGDELDNVRIIESLSAFLGDLGRDLGVPRRICG